MKKKKRKLPKRRSAAAKDLGSRKYRQRVVHGKKREREPFLVKGEWITTHPLLSEDD